ncbi:MAG: hypothetical protein CVT66_07565 [Actinobacteria bacterium HGW-Actinobacteria-6]|nr:MAG: hypothetical protein CVT66_07565 [Actinobacteria bacterium HGW-Actinobacteria-6]
MDAYEEKGRGLRLAAKELVLDFMQATTECRPGGEGMRQTAIFRGCGLDWGDYPTATSASQQFWAVALLRELEAESRVERNSKLWRLV